MADVAPRPDFLSAVRKSGLLTDAQLAAVFDGDPPTDPRQCAAALVKAGKLTTYQAAQLLAGKTRGFKLGPYTLLRPLGQGGMGVVYLADHTSLGRKVAVKVLPPDKAKDQINLERFHREARAAAALDHPNIVRLHDVCCEGGLHFLVFEYVEGRDLQGLLSETGPLHFAQAAQYVAQAAAGLHHAHQRGLVHRDIKPSNLILARDGAVKLLDMGLARSFTDKRDDLTGTLGDDGDIVGTVDYLSPEQCRNALVDERSDIYSLGATLFTLVTGHAPFNGTTAQKLMQHQLAAPPGLERLRARLPEALCDVLARMMAKAPKDRYQTAEDVVLALAPWVPASTTGTVMGGAATLPEFQTGNSSLRRRAEAPAPARGRKPVLVAAAAALVAALAVGAVLALTLGRDTPPPGPVADGEPSPAPAAQPTPATQPAPAAPVARPADPTLTAAPPGPLLYKIDFTGVPTGTLTVDKPGVALSRAEVSGRALPAGVRLNHWSGRASAVYGFADVAGHRAFIVRQTAETQGVQVHFTCDGHFDRVDRAVGVRVVYANDGGRDALTFLERDAEPYDKYGRVGLPPTGGRWAAVEAVYRRPGPDGKFNLVVRPGDDGATCGGTLALRSVEVYELATGGREVFRLSAAEVPEFRNTKKGSTVTAGAAEQLPSGVYFFAHQAATTGTFACEVADGARALRWANLSGDPTGQIGIELERPEGGHLAATAPLIKDRRYRVAVTYKTAGGAAGGAYLQTQNTFESWDGCGTDLPDTGGAWHTRTFVTARPDKPVRLLVDNHAVGADKVMFVRAVTVSEVETPAGGRTLYALDLSGQKPFRDRGRVRLDDKGSWLWASSEKTGAGTVPAGWITLPWKLDVEAEYTAEEIDGRMALGMRTPNRDEGHAMLFTPHVAFPGDRAKLAVEYRTGTGPLHVKFQRTKPTGDKARDVKTLPPTNGAWRTEVMEVNLDGATAGFFEFHNNTGGGQPAHLRAVTVTDGTAAGALAPAGKALYALDLGAQKPFAVTGTAEPTQDETEDVRFVEKAREGDGAMPTGWRGVAWDSTCEATFFAWEKAGRMALGMRNVKTGTGFPAAFTGMLFSPRMKLPAGPFRLRFGYLTDADGPNVVQVKLKPTAPDKRVKDRAASIDDLNRLPGTGGKWVTREVDVDPRGATEGYIEFHSFDLDTARGFYLSEFVVSELAPAAPPEAAPAVPVRTDFGAFTEGTFALNGDGPVGLNGRTDIAAGWWANLYRPGATGELVVGTEDGVRFVTLVNKTGEGSAQLFQAQAGPALAGGRQYMLTFEYRAAEGTTGTLQVRERDVGNWKDCPYSYKLEPTAGKWEKRTFEVEVPRNYPTVLVVQNHTAGPGNALSVRKLELVPVGGP